MNVSRRLVAGLKKLDASKAGKSDAYKEDEDGVWRPQAAASGVSDIFVRNEMNKLVKTLEQNAEQLLEVESDDVFENEMRSMMDVAEKELTRLEGQLSEDGKNRITMKLNQPHKLTVMYTNGEYRTMPFVGGEEFVAIGRKEGSKGQEIIIAIPANGALIDINNYGKVERIEVGMEKAKTIFDSEKLIEREMAAQRVRDRIVARREEVIKKANKKREEEEARMNENDIIGSW